MFGITVICSPWFNILYVAGVKEPVDIVLSIANVYDTYDGLGTVYRFPIAYPSTVTLVTSQVPPVVPVVSNLVPTLK